MKKVFDRLSVFRGQLVEHGISDLPFALLVSLVSQVLLATLAFFFGGGVHAWMFWCGMAVSAALVGMKSLKNLLFFFAVIGCAVAGAASVFAYGSWDSAICHWPMARAIVEGWNPILWATDSGLASVVGDETCSFVHILCAPKFPATASALVSVALGLFSGIGFVFTVLFAICFLTAYRFLKQEVGVTYAVAVMAALLMAAPLELMRQTLQGYVDYCRYTTMITGLCSYLLWRRTGRFGDLLLFLLGFVVAACSKSGALMWMLIVFVFAFFLHFRSQSFRRCMLGALMLFLVLGFSPYITEWVHNGSPFYPAHSYDGAKQVIDLCADQISPKTRNPAALQMGWLSRVVYAWVSHDLAVAACRWWYSDPTFTPVFKSPFVNGLTDVFSRWLWFCGLSFLVIKNRSVRIVGVFVAAMVLLLPTRCIGFYRYTPEIVVLPPLCLAAITRAMPAERRIATILRIASTVMLGYMCLYAVVFAASWFGLQWGMEAARQRGFEKAVVNGSACKIGKPLNAKLRFLCSRRLEAAGFKGRADAKVPCHNLYFAPPETFDLGLVPSDCVAGSRVARDEQIREKPIFFSYYNSLFSPFTNLARWRKYRFESKDIPKILRSN